jgi:hypothetical protein
LAGRDQQLDTALEALLAGARHPLFSHVYHGDRGTGKTVLLDAIAARCREREWPMINVACRAGTGVVEGLVQLHLPEALRTLRRGRGRRASTELRGSVGLPGVAQVSAGASWSSAQRGLGVELERLLGEVGEAADRRGVRFVIGIDELHAIDTTFDLPSLAGVLQLMTQRRGLPVAMIGAGLPEVVDVLSGPSVTFLERLRKFELAYLSRDATRYALVAPAQAQGVVFDLDAADLLTAASAGYPYYVQLLGWETWAHAAAQGAERLSSEHAQAGIRSAETVVVEQILEPRFRRLAPKEQDYLRAMAVDGDAGSTTADLVRRLDADRPNDISYLRDRLLRRHLIRSIGRGRVAFTLPGMGAWLSSTPPQGKPLPPGR